MFRNNKVPQWYVLYQCGRFCVNVSTDIYYMTLPKIWHGPDDQMQSNRRWNWLVLCRDVSKTLKILHRNLEIGLQCEKDTSTLEKGDGMLFQCVSSQKPWFLPSTFTLFILWNCCLDDIKSIWPITSCAECLYYNIWQTADEITRTIHKWWSLNNKTRPTVSIHISYWVSMRFYIVVLS